MSDRRLLALAFVAGLALLGLPDGVLGVAWPDVRDTFGRPVADLAVLSVAFTAGYLATAAASGRAAVRAGAGPVLLTAGVASTLALLAFAVSPAWPLSVLTMLVAGGCQGAIDSGLNAYLALHHGVRAMNLFHACYGVGATSGPVLATVAIEGAGTWRAAYGVLAGIAAAVTLCLVAARTAWRPVPGPAPPQPGPRGRRLDGPLLVALALFLVYVAAEVSAGQWSYSLLVEERGVSTSSAAAWVAAYWGALTAGRFAAAVAAGRAGPEMLLRASFAGAGAGTVLLWVDPGGAGVLGLPLLGVSLATVFPTLVSLTPHRLGAHRATVAMGYQFVAAGVGGVVGPSLVGALTAASGLEVLGPVLVAMVAVLVALHVVAARLAPAAAREEPV